MPDTTAPGQPAPRKPRGPNDTRQLETVSRNRQILQNVLDDPEALTLAEARNRDATHFTHGLTLADAYLKEYGQRDDATGTRTGARKTLKAADTAARKTYGTLRTLLRDEYADDPEHLERLGVSTTHAPDDRDTFLEQARATLAAVRQPPYADAVAPAGFKTKDLDAFGTALDDLQAAAGKKTSATGAHGGSTDERDDAYGGFMGWMKKTRRRLAIAYKEHPATAARVGL
ncbi:MAG TPA: hypothetical protein VGB53_01530 [Rubricoccaceae bacterium]|jgi:hypothetical protein